MLLCVHIYDAAATVLFLFEGSEWMSVTLLGKYDYLEWPKKRNTDITVFTYHHKSQAGHAEQSCNQQCLSNEV